MYKILLAVVEFANGKGQESQQGVIFQLINNFLERKFKDHVKEASRKMSILLILNVRKSIKYSHTITFLHCDFRDGLQLAHVYLNIFMFTVYRT